MGTIRHRAEHVVTDEEALRSDWEAIAGDFRAVQDNQPSNPRDRSKKHPRGPLRRR